MALSLRNTFMLVAFATPAALFACSSSSGTGGSTTSSTTTATGGHATTSSTTSSSSTTATTTSSTTATGTGGSAACEANCETSNPAAFAKFEGYILKDCGCTTGATCYSACESTTCADAGAGDAGAACTSCLEQAAASENSCALTALTVDCTADTTCKPFATCIEGCLGI